MDYKFLMSSFKRETQRELAKDLSQIRDDLNRGGLSGLKASNRIELIIPPNLDMIIEALERQ